MIELEVKIPDEPGMLIKLIKPISENCGNIHGIFHMHEQKAGDSIPVLITFEIISEDELKTKNLELIKKSLQDLNFQILRITDIPAVHQMTVMLSGHVFRNNFEDTVREINRTGAKVYDLEAKFTSPDDISNVKFLLEIPDEIDDKVIINELKRICKDKDLVLIHEEVLNW
jgi:ACT domain-containing protein